MPGSSSTPATARLERTSDSTKPITPMTIRIRPTVWMSMPTSVAVTAKYRIAPTAIRNSEDPMRIAGSSTGAHRGASPVAGDVEPRSPWHAGQMPMVERCSGTDGMVWIRGGSSDGERRVLPRGAAGPARRGRRVLDRPAPGHGGAVPPVREGDRPRDGRRTRARRRRISRRRPDAARARLAGVPARRAALWTWRPPRVVGLRPGRGLAAARRAGVRRLLARPPSGHPRGV